MISPALIFTQRDFAIYSGWDGSRVGAMKTNTTYSTKEQAERMGAAEAAKLTRRGYPTTVIEVRPVRIVTEARFYTMGDQDSAWTTRPCPQIRWEAVLS